MCQREPEECSRDRGRNWARVGPRVRLHLRKTSGEEGGGKAGVRSRRERTEGTGRSGSAGRGLGPEEEAGARGLGWEG